MKILFLHIVLGFSLVTCTNRLVNKPVWVNEKSNLSVPDVQLEFKTHDKGWEASVLGFIQPLALSIKYNDTGFTATLEMNQGTIEGPAQICISSGNSIYYYPVHLVNKNFSPESPKDYRSPKTVNPDSSLLQQRILHTIDANRNLRYTNSKSVYFEEEIITLEPKVRISRAIDEEPITSFYIQPGSCINIPLKTLYKEEIYSFSVTAGPLKDKYDNTVADGTLVAFIYRVEQKTFRKEASLLGGFATVLIPKEGNQKYFLKAKVNETNSKEIELSPR